MLGVDIAIIDANGPSLGRPFLRLALGFFRRGVDCIGTDTQLVAIERGLHAVRPEAELDAPSNQRRLIHRLEVDRAGRVELGADLLLGRLGLAPIVGDARCRSLPPSSHNGRRRRSKAADCGQVSRSNFSKIGQRIGVRSGRWRSRIFEPPRNIVVQHGFRHEMVEREPGWIRLH